MSKAYKEACAKGSKPSYKAKVNLIGHKDAGKTSLGDQLLGQGFKKDKRSTEGIATHFIKSSFKRNEMKGSTWSESTVDVEDILREFNDVVMSRNKTSANLIELAEKLKGFPSDVIARHIVHSERGYQAVLAHMETKPKPETVKSPILSKHFPSHKEHKSEGITQQSKDVKQDSHSRSTVKGENVANTDASIKAKFMGKVSMPESKISGHQTLSRNEHSYKELHSPIPMENVNEISEKHMKQLLSHKESLDLFLEENVPCTINLWDCGGQEEFYVTHHLFIDVEATTLIVMDISKSLRVPLGHPVKEDEKAWLLRTPLITSTTGSMQYTSVP